MNSKKINQLATELTPSLSDLTIIGDPSTGVSKKITLSQMASLFTGTVEEYPSFSSFPLVGVADTIYIATDTNILYRWNIGTNAYVELSPNIVTSLVFNDANGFDGTISLVGSTATLTITTALTAGSVPFIGASGALTQDNAKLFWDNTNKWLGIGTNSPSTPLDVHTIFNVGMSINNTTTNNSLLMFANQNVSKWRLGNVYSSGANYFGIYDITNSLYRFTILNSGEVGIGITNPTTKLHIDGGSSALIANLDADVSIAKSLSFRSDNSNRINLEVSGTESGSNAGANFFIRRYSDAGALIDTPFTITRSTGLISLIGTTNIKSEILLEASNSTNKWSLYTYTDNSFRMNYNGAGNDEIIMTSSGSFGIGVSPTTKFEVNDSNNIPIRFGDIAAAPSSQLAGYIGMSTSAYNGINGDLVLFPRTSAASRILLMGGKVGIGTSTVDYELTVNGNIAATNGGIYYLQRSSSSAILPIIRFWNGSGLPMTGGALGDLLTMGTQGTSAYVFATDNTERMRLQAGGELKITGAGSSNTAFSIYDGTDRRIFCIPSQYYGYILAVSVASNGGKGISFGNAGGASEVGSIVCNASSISINYSSDYRLKEDFKEFNGIDILSKVKLYDFKWKSEETRDFGVIAHELQEEMPNMVTGQKDALDHEGKIAAQGVDYIKFVPILIKAIQEQQKEIEQLKALINK
jgi:hypothetical protein